MASGHGFAERYEHALEHGPAMSAREAKKLTADVIDSGARAATWRKSLEESPEPLAAFMKTNPDPMIGASLAGDRALDDLAGFGVQNDAKPTRLEALAVRSAKDHFALASSNPALAERREKLGSRLVPLPRVSTPAPPRATAIDCGYGVACENAIAVAKGETPKLAPSARRPSGLMAGLKFPPGLSNVVVQRSVPSREQLSRDADVATEISRERRRDQRSTASRAVRSFGRGTGRVVLYAAVGPPAVAGYLAYRAGKFGYNQLAAGARRLAGGGRAIAVAARAYEVAARRRAAGFSRSFGKAYRESRDAALDRSRKMASSAGDRVADAAVQAASRSPRMEVRFRRNLVKAMERGPVAAEAFLEKVAASPVQTEVAKRAGLESVVVASAIGASAVNDVLASKVPKGDRPIDKLVHTLQAAEQKRGFDAAESGGGPLGKTIAGRGPRSSAGSGVPCGPRRVGGAGAWLRVGVGPFRRCRSGMGEATRTRRSLRGAGGGCRRYEDPIAGPPARQPSACRRRH